MSIDGICSGASGRGPSGGWHSGFQIFTFDKLLKSASAAPEYGLFFRTFYVFRIYFGCLLFCSHRRRNIDGDLPPNQLFQFFIHITRRSVSKAAMASLAFAGAAGFLLPALAQVPDKSTLVHRHSIAPATFCPWWTQAEYPRRQLLDRLIFLDDRGAHPWLATSWKQNGKVWTFKLRDDFVFSDGSQFNADTLVRNFEFRLGISTSVSDSFFGSAKGDRRQCGRNQYHDCTALAALFDFESGIRHQFHRLAESAIARN